MNPPIDQMQWLTRDGVVLKYRELGTGATPIVLVHGWACDHTFLLPQLDHLSRAHRVLAVDLCGHGQSGTPDRRYTPAEFAADIQWLCTELHWPPAIIIGHSMGGNVALEMAAIHPGSVSAICLIDSVVFPSEPLITYLEGLFSRLDGPEYQQALMEIAGSLFLETDDPARKAELLQRMSRTPQHVAVAAFRGHLFDYDCTAAVEACKVPMAYLSAAHPLADLARLRSHCPQLMTGQTIGSGHFSPVEVPEQINSMLDRFVKLATSAAGGIDFIKNRLPSAIAH
ncbi:MAG TPA: alpha/beta hydrolase [Blastocatellia bacterium]|nr:alpha/beta hydrolase [Blastocatellia bacterium]